MHIIKAMQGSGDLIIKVIKSFQLADFLSINRHGVSQFWIVQLLRCFAVQLLNEAALINGRETPFQSFGTSGELQWSGDNHSTVHQRRILLFAQIFGQRIAPEAVADSINMSRWIETSDMQ